MFATITYETQIVTYEYSRLYNCYNKKVWLEEIKFLINVIFYYPQLRSWHPDFCELPKATGFSHVKMNSYNTLKPISRVLFTVHDVRAKALLSETKVWLDFTADRNINKNNI